MTRKLLEPCYSTAQWFGTWHWLHTTPNHHTNAVQMSHMAERNLLTMEIQDIRHNAVRTQTSYTSTLFPSCHVPESSVNTTCLSFQL